MDPAETEHFKQILTTQGVLVGQHDSTLRRVIEGLQELTTSVTQLGGRMESVAAQLSTVPPTTLPPPPAATPPATPAPQPREPHIPIPARYAGDLGSCSQFLHQCSLVFRQQPTTYSSDQSRVAFVMSLLSDRASAWALAISMNSSHLCSDFQAFSSEMRKVFDHPVKGREATSQLLSLRQGNQSVAQYAVDFRILAVESGWDQAALQAVFLKGLSEEVKDELAARDDTSTLDELIDLSIRLDNRLRERRRERTDRQRARFFSPAPRSQPETPRPSPSSPPGAASEQSGASFSSPASSGPEEPMQLGRARLTPLERQRRLRLRLCIYCGEGDHFLARCPAVPKDPAHQLAGGR